jgi:hypothetical protein
MRKAKIILASISLLAVISGAIASKANKGLNRFYYATTSTGICSNPTITAFTTTVPPFGIPTYYSTAQTNTTCFTRITPIL